MIDARKALLELWLFLLRNVKVMSWRRGKLLKEYAEHGSSERLTFANFHVRVLIG